MLPVVFFDQQKVFLVNLFFLRLHWFIDLVQLVITKYFILSVLLLVMHSVHVQEVFHIAFLSNPSNHKASSEFRFSSHETSKSLLSSSNLSCISTPIVRTSIG